MRPETIYLVGSVLGVIAAGAVAVGLSRRRRKSAEERERERRLRVNAIGRICDGSILEITDSDVDNQPIRLIRFHYSVGGVDYTAAQDVSSLRHIVQAERCIEGVPASVKYDPQNPPNSIVICELWSGLR